MRDAAEAQHGAFTITQFCNRPVVVSMRDAAEAVHGAFTITQVRDRSGVVSMTDAAEALHGAFTITQVRDHIHALRHSGKLPKVCGESFLFIRNIFFALL